MGHVDATPKFIVRSARAPTNNRWTRVRTGKWVTGRLWARMNSNARPAIAMEPAPSLRDLCDVSEPPGQGIFVPRTAGLMKEAWFGNVRALTLGGVREMR